MNLSGHAAVGRHRAGRRRAQGQGQEDREAGRRRPGPDVRLRQQRNAGADAGADHVRASPRPRADHAFARAGGAPWLRPDAKSQVSVIYENGKPVGISNVVISTQHAADVDAQRDREILHREVIRKVLPGAAARRQDRVPDQPDRPLRRRRTAGRHRPHRPQDHRRQLRRHGPSRRRRVLGQGSDQGRPQRRLHGPLGGEEHRRRRSSPRAAKCSSPTPSAIPIRSACTSRPSARPRCRTRRSSRAVNRVFSFQPADIIEQLNLRRPIYSKTTNYGHFGKNDKDLTWEATNKVRALLAPCNLRVRRARL